MLNKSGSDPFLFHCSSFFRESSPCWLALFLSGTQDLYCSWRCYHPVFLFFLMRFISGVLQGRAVSPALNPQPGIPGCCLVWPLYLRAIWHYLPWAQAPAIIALVVTRACKPPRHDKAQHQGREELLTLLKCFIAFHVARRRGMKEGKRSLTYQCLHNSYRGYLVWWSVDYRSFLFFEARSKAEK